MLLLPSPPAGRPQCRQEVPGGAARVRHASRLPEAAGGQRAIAVGLRWSQRGKCTAMLQLQRAHLSPRCPSVLARWLCRCSRTCRGVAMSSHTFRGNPATCRRTTAWGMPLLKTWRRQAARRAGRARVLLAARAPLARAWTSTQMSCLAPSSAAAAAAAGAAAQQRLHSRCEQGLWAGGEGVECKSVGCCHAQAYTAQQWRPR